MQSITIIVCVVSFHFIRLKSAPRTRIKVIVFSSKPQLKINLNKEQSTTEEIVPKKLVPPSNCQEFILHWIVLKCIVTAWIANHFGVTLTVTMIRQPITSLWVCLWILLEMYYWPSKRSVSATTGIAFTG